RWRFIYKKTGHSSSSVEDGLLRFWESRIFHRGRELMGVDMLLLNSQVTWKKRKLYSKDFRERYGDKAKRAFEWRRNT
ncbi:hypothetical protein HID58_035295, partial [Brassica napus]